MLCIKSSYTACRLLYTDFQRWERKFTDGKDCQAFRETVGETFQLWGIEVFGGIFGGNCWGEVLQ